LSPHLQSFATMLSSKIQSMMHRDVDGMGVDDRHQRRHSQSQRQLGSYTDSFGQQQPDANHMHALQQRRRALAQANSQTDQMQERPSARRVASTGTLSSSASEARLLAALKRQQTNNLQDSDESADGSNAQPISAASASRAQNGTAPAVTPSAEATANGSADAKTLKVRPQIRPWKQTKGKPQDCQYHMRDRLL
jgi:hypothetical protein